MKDLFLKLTNTHWFLDSSSSQAHHFQKGILYIQALRLYETCIGKKSFEKLFKDLGGCLMERKSYDKVIKKQILRVQEHLGNDLVRE